ncbi:MAG: N-acetyltransferase [Dehalococcoidia bacterium]|nr:MAG: N-acetyltransferase [Dehalococcoidia bacterium]
MSYDGERVSLRAIEPEDIDRYLTWLNDPEVTRWLAQRYPIGREGERQILERLSRANGYDNAAFAVDDRLSGEHLGTISLFDVRPESRVAELGIFIGAKARWGEGIGYDALVTLLRFGFWEMNLRRVELSVLDGNVRAKALYERVGFVEVGRRPGHWYKRGASIDDFLMSIEREAFEDRHGAPPRLVLPGRGAAS